MWIVLVWCCAFGPLLRSEMEGDRPPPLRRYPSVLDVCKMVAVEYEGEAGFFHHGLILRTVWTAAMLNTTGRMCDSRNGLFWILSPDGDVCPELLRVPPATLFIWLNESNEPIPTTMMPAGVATWSRFTNSELTGAFCTLQKSSCERFSELKRRRTRQHQTLHLVIVQRNSAGDRRREFRNAVPELVQSPWAGWPVSGPRTFLSCCKVMSEHALHPLAHHSRFVQLSGILSTDPAAQEHELLCRAIELGLTFDQLQGAELSCFELLARRLQMLEMKLRDKVGLSLFGSALSRDRPDSWAAHYRARTGGVCFRCAGEGDGSCQGASKATRRTIRRAARWRQEEMTEPGETESGKQACFT